MTTTLAGVLGIIVLLGVHGFMVIDLINSLQKQIEHLDKSLDELKQQAKQNQQPSERNV